MISWPVLRFVWESRGKKMEVVSDALREKWPLGYAMSSLQRLTAHTMDEVPEDVAAVVLALPVEPGFEHKAQIVDAGLKALEGAEIDPTALVTQFSKKLPDVDPEVIARAVVAVLQEGKGSPLRKLARRMARLTKRLDAALSALRSMEATVNHTDAKQDVEHAKLERATRKILRAIYGSTGLLASGMVAMAFVHCQHVQPSPPAPSSPTVTVNLGAGVTEQAEKGGWEAPFTSHASVIGAGERKVGFPMPHHALPHQATAPCRGSARTLYEACWTQTSDAVPCPPDQFREGNNCYVPIAADPNVPVGGAPEKKPGQGEPTGEQPRHMQEMPGREEH